MHIPILLIILLIILVILSAFFSATETAYTSISAVKIKKIIKKHKKIGRLIEKHLKSYSRTLATILLGNNVVNVSASTATTYFFSLYFAEGTSALASTAVVTPVIVLLGEIVPKILAKRHAVGYLIKVAILMEIVSYLFLPFTFMLKNLVTKGGTTVTEEELHYFINIAHKENILEEEEANLTRRALEFDSTLIKEVMVKIEDASFVDITDPIPKIIATFRKTGFSRLPIKDNSEFVGYVYAKFFLGNRIRDIRETIQPLYTITQDAFCTKGLEQFKNTKSHMIFVTKGTQHQKIIGIVTMEDIMENLVGKIYDETDKTVDIQEVNYHRYHVLSSISMLKVQKFFNDVNFDLKKKISLKLWLKHQFRLQDLEKGAEYNYKDKLIFKIRSKKRKHFLIEIKKIINYN